MRRIDPSRAVLVFWADLVFHEAALLADDEAKHLAPQVTQALDDFNVVFKLDLDTQRSVLKANAKSSIADVHIDEGIRKLHSAALFLVDQVRKRPEFKSLFSETIDKVVRFALKRQVAIAEDLIDKLGSKIYSDDFRKPHIDSLKSLVDAGNTALADVRAAELGRTDARIDIRAWKDDVNAIRLANYGELLAIAAKSGRTKDWADAFFLKYKSSSTDGDDELDESLVETGSPTG
ncbi:MAG: hypothetical protein IPM54_35030 [Polyangiaceae bacterium]|nr:hypothetical protein [Polyangiaceae bacterium]